MGGGWLRTYVCDHDHERWYGMVWFGLRAGAFLGNLSFIFFPFGILYLYSSIILFIIDTLNNMEPSNYLLRRA